MVASNLIQGILYLVLSNHEKLSSPAGNRTPVSRVTGGDTYHYTTEDIYYLKFQVF